MEDNCYQNCVNFMPTGKTEYSFSVKSFLEKVKTGPFMIVSYVIVAIITQML